MPILTSVFGTTILLKQGVLSAASLAGIVTTLAGQTTAGSANSTGTNASFSGPNGVCMDSTAANIYVADYTNNLIRKIVVKSGVVTTLAGTTTQGSGDGTGTGATFFHPVGICIDPTNTYLYVADNGNQKIRKIVISTAVVTTFAGTGSASFLNGIGTSASFNYPNSICIDPTGTNLYVADANNNKIRQIIISSATVSTLAGNGTATFADNTTGTSASFNNPRGVTIDATGTNLYVADRTNHRIRKIVIASPSPVTTLAGNSTPAFSNNATGTSANFSSPCGIIIDHTSNYLYVCDTGNNRIRKVSLLAPYAATTLAGNGTTTWADGTGTNATFNAPIGICLNSTDTIMFVGGNADNRIRKVT